MSALVTPVDHLTVPGAARTELVSLAALIAVLHRRTTQETVRVARLDAAGARRGTVCVDLSDDLTFGQLVELVEAAVTAADPAGPGSRITEPFDAEHQVDAEHQFAGAAELAAQVQMVAAEGALRPERPLSAMSLATTAQRVQVLGFGRSGVAPVPAACVHELVEAQAARTPDRAAVSCAGTVLTYRELNERAELLAERLIGAGIGVDQVVGVLAERSVELIVALLGVLKAGGAYAAVDPDLPAARIAYLIEDTKATVVVTQQRLADRVPPGTTVLAVDAPAEPGALAYRKPRVTPGNLAYVSYTSGSTGQPKGVAIPHAAVSRLVCEPDWVDFCPEDVFLQLAPVAFDASTMEIWAPLTIGARLAVFPPGHVDLDALVESLRTEQVSVLWLTAGLFHQLAAMHPNAFSGLRHLLAGGDVVSAGQLTQVLARNPGLTFTNGYGPTENTTFTACWTGRTAPSASTVPIGPPISGTRVLVLDSDLQPTPVGVPGELYAAGEGLARCYLGQPDSTAQRFLPDPFAPHGARMYRTGDLAAWQPDGTLEFLGRADRQIKVQGFRVEPGEVEAALLDDPDVHDAVVVAQVDGARGKSLVAYVVADDPAEVGPSARTAQLREALRDRLPSYLVPWAIILLPELPLGATGKVDRSALPPARRIPRNLASGFIAPRGGLQTHIAQLWSDLLAIEPIGVDDDFFELGGHSLIAAEVLGELQKAYAVEIAARTLYLRPTIAELTEAIEELLCAAASIPPPEPASEKGPRS